MSDVTTDQPTPRVPGDFGSGPLGRFTAGVYWFVVVTALLALASLPGVLVALLLDRSVSNLPLVVLAALPLGPALSAALYATRDRTRADGLTPARSFWRGYRLNWADVLRVWAPALVALAVIGYVIANAPAAGIGPVYVAVLAGLALVITVWALHAVAIASFFNFRTRDVARLGVYYLGRMPSGSLGVVSLLVVALGIAWFTADAVLVLLGGVWVWFWHRAEARMLAEVEERFTSAAPDPSAPPLP